MLRELYYTKFLEESTLLKLKEELLLLNEKKSRKRKCQFSETRQYTLNQSSENQCFKMLLHLTLTKCVN